MEGSYFGWDFVHRTVGLALGSHSLEGNVGDELPETVTRLFEAATEKGYQVVPLRLQLDLDSDLSGGPLRLAGNLKAYDGLMGMIKLEIGSADLKIRDIPVEAIRRISVYEGDRLRNFQPFYEQN